MTTLVGEFCANSNTISKGLQIQFMDSGVAQKAKHKALARFRQADAVVEPQPTEIWVELLVQQVCPHRTDAMNLAST